MSDFFAAIVLFLCVVGMAWLTGPGWCDDAGEHIRNAPICSGAAR